MTARRGAILAVVGGMFEAFGAGSAGADSAVCGAAGPWVKLAIEGGPWDPSVRAGLLPQLRTELGQRGIEVCTASDAPKPRAVAELRITMAQENSLAVSIQVDDAITVKKIERSYDLSTIPVDGRPLAIAVFGDELLHASWAELALKTAPSPAMQVPAAVNRSLEASLRPARSPDLGAELGIAAAASALTGGQRQLGPDIRGAYWFLRRLGATARVGYRQSLSVPSIHGRIGGEMLVVGIGAEARISPPSYRAGLSLGLRFDYAQMTFLPQPDPGFSGVARAFPATLASADVAVWARMGGKTLLVVDAAFLSVVNGAQATDTGTPVTGFSGIGGEVALSFRRRL